MPAPQSIPLRAAFFDGSGDPKGPGLVSALGNITRTWVLWLQSLGPVYERTISLKDLTPGNDIAPHLTIFAANTGVPQAFTGVLRKAITADLVVRVNYNGTPLCTLTVPKITPVDSPVVSTTFPNKKMLWTNGVLTWDVLASDG